MNRVKHELGPLEADMEIRLEAFFNAIHVAYEHEDLRADMLNVAHKQMGHIYKVMGRIYQAAQDRKEIAIPHLGQESGER